MFWYFSEKAYLLKVIRKESSICQVNFLVAFIIILLLVDFKILSLTQSGVILMKVFLTSS